MNRDAPGPRRSRRGFGLRGRSASRRDRTPGHERLLSVVLSGSVAEAASIADAISSLHTVAADLASAVEVVLAPWGPGSTDVLHAIAERAPLDVLVAPVAETGNGARNTGAALAHAPHVMFLDPLTRLRPGALQRLVAATGQERGYRVVRAVGERNPFNPASFLFRATYLRDSAMSFEEEHGDFPDATCARALAARPVRVEGQLWDRVARSGAASGAMPSWSADIEAWLAMLPTVRQMVHGPEKAQWIRDLVIEVLPGLLADAERLPYELLPEVADAVGAVLAAMPPNDLARLPVEPRATAWLGGQARWTELAEVLARRTLAEGQFPTRVEGVRAYADLPGADWAALHAPPQMLEIGLDESRLTTSVRRTRWLREADGSPVLAVDVFALVRHLSLNNPTVLARWVGREGAVPASVRLRPDPHVAVTSGLRYQDQSHGSVTVLTRLDELRTGSWHLELAVTQGGIVRTGRLQQRDLTGSAGALRPAPDGRARLVWDESGLRIDVGAPATYPTATGGVRVRGVRVEDDWLAIDCSGPVRGPVELVSPAMTLVGHVDATTVRFRLRGARFGLPEQAVPSGRYRLFAGTQELLWEPTSEDDTGFDLLTEDHRVCCRRGPRHGVVLDVRPPLRDDELGPFGQVRLLTSYDTGRPLSDVVLLESNAGGACTGSPLAVDRELVRSRPGLRRVWVVADHSVVVPPGATGVLRRSREWHSLLATARLVVTDGDLPPFFSRRSGQLVLQTLSGYPARTMGVDAWTERNFAPRRIEHLVSRSSAQWSALTAPSVRLQHWFRESFRYDGELLALGLPRTDLLAGPDTAYRRETTRRLLGIDAEQTVLFYAPEPGAHPVYGVRPREILDVAELADRLGPGWTVLLRDPASGRRPVESDGARVVDVTDHPEVADLMLAADAGLFDYSALRFDFALTGKPTVFQVPDPSVRRGDARGFLFPYTETAPGPVVGTADEVAAALADLDELHRLQAAPLARFNAEFNDMADGQVASRVVAELFGPRFGQSGLALAGTRPPLPDDQGPQYEVVRRAPRR